MGRKPTGNPVGPPKKSIDWVQFEQLAGLQCTQSEIASVLKVHENTLSDRVKEHYGEDYSTVYKKFQENGKSSLRRNQFVLSKKNASMAIWLGKIWLGQKDPGFDETKEEAINALRKAIQEVMSEPRIESTKRPSLEDKSSLLD